MEAFGLLYGDGLHESELVHVRDQRRHAMVAKPTCESKCATHCSINQFNKNKVETINLFSREASKKRV